MRVDLPVSAVTTEVAEFKALEAKAAEEGKVLVVDFSSRRGAACAGNRSSVREPRAEAQRQTHNVLLLDAEKSQRFAKYNVKSFPNFKFLFGGRVVGEAVRGASPEEFEREVRGARGARVWRARGEGAVFDRSQMNPAATTCLVWVRQPQWTGRSATPTTMYRQQPKN